MKSKQFLTKCLLKELKEIMNGLTQKKFKKEIITFNKKKYTFTKMYMNHTIYDTMMYSGELLNFSPQIQYELSSIFEKVKGHKETYDNRNHLIDLIWIHNHAWAPELNYSAKHLSRIEIQLKEQIPKLAKKLEKSIE